MTRKPALRRVWIVVAASIAALPALLQPLPVAASSTGTLFGIDIRRPAVVSIDPSTGVSSPVADLSLAAGQPAPGFMDTMASDPATHRVFLVRNVFDFSNGFPTITNQLITADTTGKGILNVSLGLGHPVTSLAFDTSTGTLLGFTGDCCPNQIVSINPANGALTHIADVIGDSFSFMAFSPSTHSIYVDSESFALPFPNPPTNTLLIVDTTQVDHVTIGPTLSPGVNSLAFDTSLGALFGTTFFPPHFVRVDTTTGVETPLGTYDFGFFLEPGVAIDPATHTFFKVQDVFDDPIQGPIAHIVSINDQTGAGVLGGTTGTNLAAIVFEPVLITPESIKAEVRAALASGAITNAGIANSLLAKLNAARDARSRGQCATAANIYAAFINELNAQSGKHVAAATASQLISEAKFLIAHCP
jgi:FIMAH domain-containing protein